MSEFTEYDVDSDHVTEELRQQSFKDAHELIDKARGPGGPNSDLDYCVFVVKEGRIETVGNASMAALRDVLKIIATRLIVMISEANSKSSTEKTSE